MVESYNTSRKLRKLKVARKTRRHLESRYVLDEKPVGVLIRSCEFGKDVLHEMKE